MVAKQEDSHSSAPVDKQINEYIQPPLQKIIDIKEKYKVGRRKTDQMKQGEEQREIYKKKNSFFSYTFHVHHEEKQANSWLIENTLRQTFVSKPKCIRLKDKASFTIEITTKECSKMTGIMKINEIPVTIAEYNNKHKGLVYIYQYDLDNFKHFRKGMIEKHNLHYVVLAMWVK